MDNYAMVDDGEDDHLMIDANDRKNKYQQTVEIIK